jgi:hypothetical protein
MGSHRTRFRWIITHVIVFLLLGAMVNVAVAWGICCMPSTSMPGFAPHADVAQNIQRVFGDELSLSSDSSVGIVVRGVGVNRESYAAVPITGSSLGILLIDAGWPLYSLHGEVVRNGKHSVHHSCTTVPFRIARTDVLPFGLLWPGFAINTLFYAAILWLLFAAPFALRRRRRINRGLCPACAYPVGDSEVCTECGKPHTVKPKEMAA